MGWRAAAMRLFADWDQIYWDDPMNLRRACGIRDAFEAAFPESRPGGMEAALAWVRNRQAQAAAEDRPLWAALERVMAFGAG